MSNTQSKQQYSPNDGVQHVQVSPEEAGQRIDNFLLRLIGQVPKALIYRILRKGEVRVNKKRCKPTYKIQAGDIVRIPPINLVEKRDSDAVHIPEGLIQKLRHRIIHEDADLLILDKPPRLSVHTGSGVEYGAIDVLRADRGEGAYLELAHRLDRDTSGILVVAKHARALRAIQQAMQSHDSVKRYALWVHGHWDPRHVEVDKPLVRTQRGDERIVEVSTPESVRAGEAKSALTKFSVLGHYEVDGQRLSKLQAELVTGRTHQIRVHVRSMGHPIIYDPKYGSKQQDKSLQSLAWERQLKLRAVSLAVWIDGTRLQFTAAKDPQFDPQNILEDHER